MEFNIFVRINLKRVKKFLYSFFLFALFFSGFNANANPATEPSPAVQKADDGILVAYPNPARDFIILKVKDGNTKIKTVAFYSILGVQVFQVNVNRNSAEISLDKLRSGKYLMKYTLEDGTQKVSQIVKI